MKKYFSQSVFGNSASKLLSERKSYNSNSLGDFGYGIYVNGSEVAFTTNKSYTYRSNVSGNVSITVKAEYRNFKSSASNGVSVNAKATADDSGNNNNSNVDNNLEVNAVSSTTTFSIGSYAESGVTVTYNGADVTSESQISYSVDINGETRSYSSISELEAGINSIQTPGTYTITYKVMYNGNAGTTSKSITLK